MAKKSKAKKSLSVVVAAKDQHVFSFGELNTSAFKVTQRIMAGTKEVKSVTIRPLPRSVYEGEGDEKHLVEDKCLAGLLPEHARKGQAVMAFASKIEAEFTARVIADVTRMIMSGEAVITSMTKTPNGRGGIRWKPKAGAVMTLEQHAAALGLSVEQVKALQKANAPGKAIDVAAEVAEQRELTPSV